MDFDDLEEARHPFVGASRLVLGGRQEGGSRREGGGGARGRSGEALGGEEGHGEGRARRPGALRHVGDKR